MRRPRFALTSAIAAVGLSATVAIAQQPRQGTTSSASAPVASDDPMLASKAARYLLRNGMDYMAYREYDRALSFLRAAEARQGELSDAERQQLKKGIAKAQDAKREAVNGARLATVKNGRATAIQPGAIALARPAAKFDNVQLTAATIPEPTAPAQAPAAAPAPMPAMAEPGVAVAGIPASAPVEAPIPVPALPAVPPASAALELPPLPAPPESLPDLAAPAPVAAPMPTPVPMPTQDPAPPVAPAVGGELPALPPLEAQPGGELPSLPSAPVPTPVPVATPLPMPEASPAADPSAMPARANPPMLPEPAPAPYQVPAGRPAPEPVPAAEASPVPMPSPSTTPPSPMPDASDPANPESIRGSLLSPRLQAEIDRLAQRPTDSVTGESTDPNAPVAPTQGSTRLELTRPPSPTEARPLRKIPVPEEFTTLSPRKWDPARKYWSAAGTCHMTLYFQDPVLERYGQGVEQSLGPIGRYFSYPLDDPRQSNQRNQILQPFYSMGKLAFQVGTLPYKLVVDPPWEAEYDLGYYRPGDKIPADTIMITPFGVGPPLKGRNY